MKKGLKTKLFLSVASLALVAGTLSTSTYAWFTTNASASVDQIEAEAKSASDSIYMSTNGINFYDHVTVTAGDELKLSDVTYDSGYVDLSGTAATISSTVASDGKSVTCNGDVLQFVIYFKTTGNNTDITFESATFATTGATAFTLLADYGDDAAGTSYTAYLTDATRLAVVPYGAVTVTDGTVAAGTAGDRSVYTTNGTDTAEKGDASDDNIAIDYYEAIMGEISSDAPTCPTETDIANPAKGNVIVSGAQAGTIYKVEFSFYIEGYDADCLDAILGQGCTIDLTFGLASNQA